MSKPRVLVTGGGFSGIAAAIAARKVGAEAILLERTDMLGGAGLKAGRLYHNGKKVGGEEAKALGATDVLEALESIVLHHGNIIDEDDSLVYNTGRVDTTMRKILDKAGVEVHLQSRATEVEKEKNSLKAVTTAGGERFAADAFVDATGSFGGMSNCIRYGHGCVMCIHRCLFFGDRVSIAAKAGIEELHWTRPDGTPGANGAAIGLYKESLSPELQARLKKEGAFSVPIPEELIDYSRLKQIGAARGDREVSHINLADIGLSAKCVGIGDFPLAKLRKIPGFENATIEHPMGGGGYNFTSHLSITPRENSMRARGGLSNLFVAGDKTGVGGVVEVIATGTLAGYNAVGAALGKELVELPRKIALGEMIAIRGENMASSKHLTVPYSMAHGVLYNKMKEQGLANADPAVVRKRISDLGLAGIFSKKLV